MTTATTCQYSIHHGLQASIKTENPFAVYAPCSAHSLNLIGTYVAECCTEVCAFFDFLQQKYGLLQCLYSSLGDTADPFVFDRAISNSKETQHHKMVCSRRCMSQPEWKLGTGRYNALLAIEGDLYEKPTVCNEASGILRKMENWEPAIMPVIWGTLLNIINVVSKQLFWWISEL